MEVGQQSRTDVVSSFLKVSTYQGQTLLSPKEIIQRKVYCNQNITDGQTSFTLLNFRALGTSPSAMLGARVELVVPLSLRVDFDLVLEVRSLCVKVSQHEQKVVTRYVVVIETLAENLEPWGQGHLVAVIILGEQLQYIEPVFQLFGVGRSHVDDENFESNGGHG